jgi:hypothetical protein
LPFDVTVRERVRRERGSVATAVVAFFCVVFFCVAAVGGFALSRVVGGRPVMPPQQTTTSTPTTMPAGDDAGELVPRDGDATGATSAQGGGFRLPVPRDWVTFTEVSGQDVPSTTRFYYVSPDGTGLVTVERVVGFYPDHRIGEYVDDLKAREPEVLTKEVYDQPVAGLPANGIAPAEDARELSYRTITSAAELVPRDQNAQDQNRVTFARFLPYARDLWVVSMTVPVEQEDAGRDLFERIAKDFELTG